MLLEVLYQGCHGRSFLSDSNIDTINRVALLIEALLIDDSINGNGCLTCLAVTNDKLTLTTTNRNH